MGQGLVQLGPQAVPLRMFLRPSPLIWGRLSEELQNALLCRVHPLVVAHDVVAKVRQLLHVVRNRGQLQVTHTVLVFALLQDAAQLNGKFIAVSEIRRYV